MAEAADEILNRARKVKLLILDCDGVLTDGRIIPLSTDDETKSFDVKDGHGIRLAASVGLKTAVITGRASFAVRTRARDLGIAHLHELSWDKIEPYAQILSEEGLTDSEVCYVGDDVTDIPLLRRVGLAVAVSDAVEEVAAYSHYVCRHRGGRGAVREVIELILKAQGKWDQALERYLK